MPGSRFLYSSGDALSGAFLRGARGEEAVVQGQADRNDKTRFPVERRWILLLLK